MRKLETLEEMNEVLGEPVEGERREVVSGPDEAIRTIKESLKTNFSVTIWTHGWTEDEKINESRFLTENEIVHCWDKYIDAILCFRSTEDLVGFYENLKADLAEQGIDLTEV